MVDIICLGELLIDFISGQASDLITVKSFGKYPGGAAGNVAVGVSKLGSKAGIISRVGKEPFGQFLIQTMNEHGVDTSLVYLDEKRKTGLAFVALDEKRVPNYLFYRDPSASMFLCPEDIEENYFQKAIALYFSSMSLVNEPFRSANYRAIDYARKYGLFVAFDPNVRISLWTSKVEAITEIKRVLEHVDVLKINTEELSFLQQTSPEREGIKELFAEFPNIKIVALTLGDKGALLRDSKGNEVRAESLPVVAEDTTGAGDAFMAALLNRLIKNGGLEGGYDLLEICHFANAAAAAIIQKTGVIPAMPGEGDIQDMLLKLP